MLGPNSDAIIATAFLETGHGLSYEHVVFAEREGVVVGMSLAYTGVQHRGFSDEPLKRAAGRGAPRMKLVRFFLAPPWRLLDTVEEGDFFLLGIVVEPELRGEGVGRVEFGGAEADLRVWTSWPRSSRPGGGGRTLDLLRCWCSRQCYQIRQRRDHDQCKDQESHDVVVRHPL